MQLYSNTMNEHSSTDAQLNVASWMHSKGSGKDSRAAKKGLETAAALFRVKAFDTRVSAVS